MVIFRTWYSPFSYENLTLEKSYKECFHGKTFFIDSYSFCKMVHSNKTRLKSFTPTLNLAEQALRNAKSNRDSESVVFNSGQKMALRAVYIVICQSFCQSFYEVKRSQRHLLAAIENNRLEDPILYFAIISVILVFYIHLLCT